MSKCSFCKSQSHEGLEWKEYIRCAECAAVSKKCRKENGIYYDISSERYISGHDLPMYPEGNLIIMDLHGVTDLLTYQEFKDILRDRPVILLSFVGSTTQTRIEAHAQIKGYGVPGFLCFHRGETAAPGNKGGFIRELIRRGYTVDFYDDGPDHVTAAREAGAEAYLVSDKGKLISLLN